MGLTEYWDGLRKALSGLTAAERRFQPHRHANHIDFLVVAAELAAALAAKHAPSTIPIVVAVSFDPVRDG